MSIGVSGSYNITLRIDTVLGSINCNFVSYYLMHIAFKMSPTIYNFDLSLNSSFYGLLVSGRIKNFTKDCILFVKNKMRSHGDQNLRHGMHLIFLHSPLIKQLIKYCHHLLCIMLWVYLSKLHNISINWNNFDIVVQSEKFCTDMISLYTV